MPKCPSCGREIDQLDYHETKTYDAKVDLVDGRLVHSDEDVQTDDMSYSCPLCNEDICMADNDAIDFLRGGKQ